MTDLKPHPVAALFPMLPYDELSEMAADIKQRGQLHPIVVWQGQILDGRNRYEACKLADVEPRFETYEGDDAAGYALAANIVRRSLTKGQVAMVVARSLPLSGKTQQQAALTSGASQSRISQAVVVLKYAGGLADAVVSGAVGLTEAYETAQDAKRAAEGEEAQLERLRSQAPDLADQVVEGSLSLKAAQTELAERQRKRAEEQRDARDLLVRILDLTAPPNMSESFVSTWADKLGQVDPDLIKRTEQASQVLLSLAERIKE